MGGLQPSSGRECGDLGWVTAELWGAALTDPRAAFLTSTEVSGSPQDVTIPLHIPKGVTIPVPPKDVKIPVDPQKMLKYLYTQPQKCYNTCTPPKYVKIPVYTTPKVLHYLFTHPQRCYNTCTPPKDYKILVHTSPKVLQYLYTPRRH